MTSAIRVWSLWDMLERDAGKLIGLFTMLNATTHQFGEMEKSKTIGGFHRPDFELLLEELQDLHDFAGDLDLPASQGAASDGLKLLRPVLQRTPEDKAVMLTVMEFMKAKSLFARLVYIKFEAQKKLFLGLDARSATLWLAKSPPFGEEVQDAFPSAKDDIEEAAKCLAVDRGTACVMHLMRAMEAPLKAMATALGVKQQNDWGSYIREVDKELDRRMKASGKRSSDEGFYAEASEAFERVKRAWRNKSMHLEHSYSPERARDIFEATKGFMAHLAPRIQEK